MQGRTGVFEKYGQDDHDLMEITSREYGALLDIRGLESSAHSMVMIAKQNPDGSYTLKGSPKTFDNLASDLSQEIQFELSPKNNLRALARLYDRIVPDEF